MRDEPHREVVEEIERRGFAPADPEWDWDEVDAFPDQSHWDGVRWVADAKQGENKVVLNVVARRGEYTIEVLEVRETFALRADNGV